jgi:hypothetical protein
VPIDPTDVYRWLFGTLDQVAPLARVPGVDASDARPLRT